MADDPRPLNAAEQAGERAARNTVVRAIGEILGKLASFVVFAALARTVGAADLGAFVFAFAWSQLASIPIGLGFDRYLLRRIAVDRSSVHELFFNALGLKLVRSLPLAAVSFAAVGLLGYDSQTRMAIYVLTVGMLLDSSSRTVFAVFNAFERGDLIAATVVVQRYAAAILGLAALAAGGGVVAVSVTFSVGTGLGLGLAFVLMARSIGIPRRSLRRAGRDELRQRSRGYAVQDVLGNLLARLDAIVLSFFATDASVGRYGAAYRVLEATFFLTSAINGAFAAMYAYLDRDTDPTVGSVFERSLKLTVTALMPVGVAVGLLADPISRLLFGDDLGGAAEPLRLLAPVVVLMGVVTIGSSLLVGRREPAVLVRIAFGAVALNVALNLALIPPLDESGAAAAMLATVTVFGAVVLREAAKTVGGVRWRAMLAGPLAAGAAMAVASLPLSAIPALALAAGLVAYLAVLLAVERTMNPADLEFVVGMVRRRLSSRPAA